MSSGIHQTTFLREASDPVILGQHQTRAKHRMREPDTKQGTGYQRRSARTANVRKTRQHRTWHVQMCSSSGWTAQQQLGEHQQKTWTFELDVTSSFHRIFLTVARRTSRRRSSGQSKWTHEWDWNSPSVLIPRMMITAFIISINIRCQKYVPVQVIVRQQLEGDWLICKSD